MHSTIYFNIGRRKSISYCLQATQASDIKMKLMHLEMTSPIYKNYFFLQYICTNFKRTSLSVVFDPISITDLVSTCFVLGTDLFSTLVSTIVSTCLELGTDDLVSTCLELVVFVVVYSITSISVSSS